MWRQLLCVTHSSVALHGKNGYPHPVALTTTLGIVQHFDMLLVLQHQ